ncbi:hypothetical protein P2W68_15275 [Chryseobacterium arthrosphaerae]|uniref:hypothetical protein n=1 Tax=Chryseobacterium arthrosphaerae TaxID=651561 RepID=UPI0023E13E5F|nr:hypothetical protein [Chryseobacterium arthrosphaerae]WES96213.1 hypothetical protein P2W68_15275 [Chryseobacterium arthrosphaerae]
MTLFEKKLFITLFLLFITVFSQQRKNPINLAVKEDYTHAATSVIFPTLWSGFQRVEINSYDLQNKHIAVSYIQQKDKKTKTTLTLYLYPIRSTDNQTLRDYFLSYEYALNQNSNKGTNLTPSFGSLSNDQVKVNYIYSIFDHSMGELSFFKGVKYTQKKSLLSIYECGGWNFKIRVSSDDMNKDQLTELKDKIENYFSVLNIASKKPLPIDKAPDIILSPVVKRDSMMTHATISAAQAKIDWLGKNMEKKELITGFNDMNIESEVYAIEKMLDFYKAHEKDWPMHDDTKKYFNEMLRIADNGRIKDHIYYKYNGVINYDEGAAKKDDYIQFRIDKNISENTNELFYKIYYRLE